MDGVNTQVRTRDHLGASIPRPSQPELWPLWSAFDDHLRSTAADLQKVGLSVVEAAQPLRVSARHASLAAPRLALESTLRMNNVMEETVRLQSDAPWTLAWPSTHRLFQHVHAEGERLSTIAEEVGRHAQQRGIFLDDLLPSIAFFRGLRPLDLCAFVALAVSSREES